MITVSKQKYIKTVSFAEKLNFANAVGVSNDYLIRLALECAKSVIYTTTPEVQVHCHTTIEIVEKCLDGEVTKEECTDAALKIYGIAAGIGHKEEIITTPQGPAMMVGSTNHPERSACYSSGFVAEAVSGSSRYGFLPCIHQSILDASLAVTDWSTGHLNDKTLIAEIVDKHLSWNFILAFQIACAVLDLGDKFRDTRDETVKKLFMLPEPERNSLFQYAEIILESDGLKEQFSFLMNDWAKRSGIISSA